MQYNIGHVISSSKFFHFRHAPGRRGQRVLQVEEPALVPLVLCHLHAESYTVLRSLKFVFRYLSFAKILQGTEQSALGAHPDDQRSMSANKSPGLGLGLLLAQVPRRLRHRIFVIKVKRPAAMQHLAIRLGRISRRVEELAEVVASWTYLPLNSAIFPYSCPNHIHL